MTTARRRLSRWFLPGLGVLSATATLTLVLTAGGRLSAALLEGAFALALAGALFVVGYSRFTTTDLPAERTRIVAAWTLAGFGLLAAMNVWFRTVGAFVGETASEFVAVTSLTAGTLAGAVVGISAARSKDRHAQRERAFADYREIFEKAEDGIAINDPETGTIVEVNQRYAEMVGYDPEELQGMTVEEISADDPNFDQAAAMARIDRALAGEPQQFDWLLERADGSHLWAEVTLKRTAIGGQQRLLAVVRDASERVDREQGIAALHEASTELPYASTPEEVAAATVDIASRVFDEEVAAMWFHDAETDRLVPAAESEQTAAVLDEAGLAELPPITADNPGMAAFRDGEVAVLEDYDDAERTAIPELSLGRVVVVPVGEYGVLAMGGGEVGELTETERQEVEILAANARGALVRADREQEMAVQLDRMEFFNSILRHDVLNGMTVIRARGEHLAEELDGEEGRYARTIVKWSDDVTEIVGRVRSVLDTLTGDESLELGPTDLSGALRTEVGRVADAYPAVTIETEIPDGVFVRADDLVGEVFGNLLTNAVDHNDPENLRVDVTVTEGEEAVTVRVADDGQGVPDDKKDAVFRRGETGHAKSTGSGFGLFFVDAMVEEYGGSVRIEDNDPTGAVFVVELPPIGTTATGE